MWPFKRKTRWQLAQSGAVKPGYAIEATLTASRIREGTRVGLAWAEVTSNGREDEDTSYHGGDGLPATDSATTLKWFEEKVLQGVEFTGETMTVPIRVPLPIWAPPSAIGDIQLTRPQLRLNPLPLGGEVTLDVDALPVHHTLIQATGALGWQFVRGQLWARSGKKLPRFEQRLTFKPGTELQLDKATVTDVCVVPQAISPVAAKVSLTVFARKFPSGRFAIARVEDLMLRDDAEAWAAEVRSKLTAALANAKLPNDSLLDGDIISTWLS